MRVGVEPDRLAALALAELRARRREQQRVRQSVRRVGAPPSSRLGRPADQLQAGRDVAPLVGAAHLQLDAHGPVQVLEVRRLEEHVAELGERQAALEPDLDGVLGEHVRDREVLADVAQEVEQAERPEPVEVVDHQRAARRRRRSRGIARAAPRSTPRSPERLARQQVPLAGPARRITDHPGPATDQRDRPAAVPLQADQPEDRHEMADVQPRRRGIEAVVGRDRPPLARRVRAGPASSRGTCRATRAPASSPPARTAGGAAGSSRHRLGRRVVSTRGGEKTGRTAPYAIVAAEMQTALERRQRHRRPTAPPGADVDRPGPPRRCIAIPLLLVSRLPRRLGGVGLRRSARTTTTPRPARPQGDPRPSLDFEQPSIVYDRTGNVELARFGVLRRELVDVRPASRPR